MQLARALEGMCIRESTWRGGRGVTSGVTGNSAHHDARASAAMSSYRLPVSLANSTVDMVRLASVRRERNALKLWKPNWKPAYMGLGRWGDYLKEIKWLGDLDSNQD